VQYFSEAVFQKQLQTNTDNKIAKTSRGVPRGVSRNPFEFYTPIEILKN